MNRLIRFVVLCSFSILFHGVLSAQVRSEDLVPAKDEKRVIYRKHNVVDFDALTLEGDIRNPGDFYFVHRKQEKFDSLVKRRPHFHREMMRDMMMIR